MTTTSNESLICIYGYAIVAGIISGMDGQLFTMLAGAAGGFAVGMYCGWRDIIEGRR